jgi:4-hydroxy 2-oxovalerate aldolase
MQIRNLFDVTLRDGALGLGFPYTKEQTAAYLSATSDAGIRHSEIGFVHGAGHFDDVGSGFNSHVDGQDVQDVLNGTEIAGHRMIDGDNPRLLTNGGDAGLPQYQCSGMIRVTCRSADLSDVSLLVTRLAEAGHSFAINLKHCAGRPTEDIARAAARAQEVGAAAFYVVDTSGSMTPNDVRRHTSAAVSAAAHTAIGFHGHDNLGLSVANSIAAFDAGATLIDASLAGVGAGGGNTPLEALMLLADDITYEAWDHLMRGLTILPQLSADVSQRAVWGFLSVDSAQKGEYIRRAESGGVDVIGLAWSEIRGKALSRNGHSRVDVFEGRGGRAVVRKTELTPEAKLSNEIEYLRIDRSPSVNLPTVLGTGHALGRAYYDMPHFEGSTLSALVLGHDPSARDLVVDACTELRRLWLTRAASVSATDFAHRMYKQRPIDRLKPLTADWTQMAVSMRQGHWISADRVGPETLLRLVASAPSVSVEEKRLISVQELPDVLNDAGDALIPSATDMVSIHGDPHFGNIVANRGDRPHLLDPGPFTAGGDAAYDVAKMLLSLGPHDQLLAGDIEPFQFRVDSGGLEVRGVRRVSPGATNDDGRQKLVLARQVVESLTESSVVDRSAFELRVAWVYGIHHVSIAASLASKGWVAAAILLEGLSALSDAHAR